MQRNMNGTELEECDWSSAEASHWMYTIQVVVSILIISENIAMLTAIVQNWYNLTRQHNMYRYLMSLVFADLLYGGILFVHGILTVVAAIDRESLFKNYLKDLANNIIIGVLHGSCFASLASASLLNLVIRTTHRSALARAAAIDVDQKRKLAFFRLPTLRSPKTARVLIGFIWVLTLTFVVAPLKIHCHEHIARCKNANGTFNIFNGSDIIDKTTTTRGSEKQYPKYEGMDCSFLRPPNSRTYVLVLNICIATSWFLMLCCNMTTIFVKTTVKKAIVAVSGTITLTLTRKFGVSFDSSSIFVAIITLSMTISTLPYVLFSFTTESGRIKTRIYYAETLSPNVAMMLEMTTCISSLLNPIIYTAMLGKLRNELLLFLNLCHKRRSRIKSFCFTCCPRTNKPPPQSVNSINDCHELQARQSNQTIKENIGKSAPTVQEKVNNWAET